MWVDEEGKEWKGTLERTNDCVKEKEGTRCRTRNGREENETGTQMEESVERERNNDVVLIKTLFYHVEPGVRDSSRRKVHVQTKCFGVSGKQCMSFRSN